ncbi:MAG: hypothetical protein IKE65_08980 [Clostridia bacterium]|nr:hypothetical protein [Clostridia bacterium]
MRKIIDIILTYFINLYRANDWGTLLLYFGAAFLVLLFTLFTIVGFWGMLTKAGEKGWKILIPFYNLCMIVRLSEQKGIKWLLFFIPIFNVVFWFITMLKIAGRFGQSAWFAVGLFFLPAVFTLIAGFGKAECANPNIDEEEAYYYYYKPQF